MGYLITCDRCPATAGEGAPGWKHMWVTESGYHIKDDERRTVRLCPACIEIVVRAAMPVRAALAGRGET